MSLCSDLEIILASGEEINYIISINSRTEKSGQDPADPLFRRNQLWLEEPFM